jgi:hypothetical protein
MVMVGRAMEPLLVGDGDLPMLREIVDQSVESLRG